MAATSSSELVLQLAQVHTKFQKQLSGPFSQHGISFTEYLVLRELANAANNRMRRIDLAQAVGLSASGVTRLLNPMEKIGLITKEEAPRDARVSLVALTSAGESVFQDASVTFGQTVEWLLEPIAAKERAVLSKLFSILL